MRSQEVSDLDVRLSEAEATLFALGIRADSNRDGLLQPPIPDTRTTHAPPASIRAVCPDGYAPLRTAGALAYTSTDPRDGDALVWLMRSGASQNAISEFGQVRLVRYSRFHHVTSVTQVTYVTYVTAPASHGGRESPIQYVTDVMYVMYGRRGSPTRSARS